MPTDYLKNIIITPILILSINTSLGAQDVAPSLNKGYIEKQEIPEAKKGALFGKHEIKVTNPKSESNLSGLQKLARAYRVEGLKLQQIGNLNEAMSFYQKAIELDPLYAVAYNDLGVIYESNKWDDRAEQSYLQAIKCDPDFLSAYSNLALFYEKERDFDKAIIYWKKRAELGLSDDPWTQKAKQRISDIRIVGQGMPYLIHEQEVIGLTKDVLNQKYATREDDRELARIHFQKAKLSYERQDEVTALKVAIDAQLLDPSNKEIEAFIEKIQKRLLTK